MLSNIFDDIFSLEKQQIEKSIQFNNTILIQGDSGIGKTSIITSILQCNNINYKFYDSISYKNDKIINEMLNINYNDMLHKFNSLIVKKKYALIIDNIDNISLMNEKQIISNLIEYNAKHKKFIIICICNVAENSNKYFTEIKKMSDNIHFHRLSSEEIHKLLIYSIEQNSIKIKNSKCIKLLLLFIGSDLRKLNSVVNDLRIAYGKNEITITKLNHYFETTNEKQCNVNSFNAIKEIIFNYSDHKKIVDIYNSNKVLIPLIFHENYYKDIFNRNLNNTQICTLIKQISNYISYGDIIETNIYTDQNWHLQNMHSFVSCMCSSFCLNKFNQYTSKNDISYEITFSSELNKTSLKNINRKNISNISLINNNNIYDFLLMGTFINEMLNEDKHEQLKYHLSSYKTDEKTWTKPFETLLKIDKTNPVNNTMTTKLKKMVF